MFHCKFRFIKTAKTNLRLKLITSKKSKAISRRASKEFAEKHHHEFPIDVFQTGSGTSSNMNANEVIANLATKYAKVDINANDDVNMSQSSNDVIPTAIKISAHIDLIRKLFSFRWFLNIDESSYSERNY